MKRVIRTLLGLAACLVLALAALGKHEEAVDDSKRPSQILSHLRDRAASAVGGINIDANDLGGDPRLNSYITVIPAHDSPSSSTFEIQYDRNFDGIVDYARTVRVESISSEFRGKTPWFTEEWDEDGNGVLDHRRSWKWIGGAQGTWSVTSESDIHENGTRVTDSIDTVTSRLRKQVGTIQTGLCGDLSEQEIRNALDKAIDQGLPCLDGVSPLDALVLRKALLWTTINIECEAFASGDDADIITEPEPCDAAIMSCESTIRVNPAPNKRANLPATLFHELLHLAGLRINPNHNAGWTDDRRDQVYGCERYCFPASGQPNDYNCRRCAMLPATGGTCPPKLPTASAAGSDCYACNKNQDDGTCGQYPFPSEDECWKHCTKYTLACQVPNACKPCGMVINRPAAPSGK